MVRTLSERMAIASTDPTHEEVAQAVGTALALQICWERHETAMPAGVYRQPIFEAVAAVLADGVPRTRREMESAFREACPDWLQQLMPVPQQCSCDTSDPGSRGAVCPYCLYERP